MFDDLKLNDMADTVKMEVLHPATGEVIKDKDGNPMWIELYPKESAQGRIAERRIIDGRLKRKGKNFTASDMENGAIEMTSALTKDWYLVKGDGTPADYPCDDETKQKFYSDDSLKWIRDQVDTFVVDISNFFKG